MVVLVTDPTLAEQLIAERQAAGSDRYDEVWEGTYMMAPMPNDQHQEIVMRLGAILQEVVGWPGLADVRAGVNVSDREDDWRENYRVPDVAVFLRGVSAGGQARNCGAFWLGGPDFLVEVVSPGDRSTEKLSFYSAVGVREALLIQRDPWSLQFYQRRDDELVRTQAAEVDADVVLASQLVPLTFCLKSGDPRPQIEVVETASQKQWLV